MHSSARRTILLAGPQRSEDRIATRGRRLEPIEHPPRLGERRRRPSPVARAAERLPLHGERASEPDRPSEDAPELDRLPERRDRLLVPIGLHRRQPVVLGLRWPRTRCRNRAIDEIEGVDPTTAPPGRTPRAPPRACPSLPRPERGPRPPPGTSAAPARSPDPSAARPMRSAPTGSMSRSPLARAAAAPASAGSRTRVHAPRSSNISAAKGRPRASPSALPTVRALDGMTPDAAPRRAGRPNAGRPVHPRPLPSDCTRTEWISRPNATTVCRRPFGLLRRARRGSGERLDQQRVRFGVAVPRRDRDRTRLPHDRDGVGVLSAVVAVVPERAKQRRPRTKIAFALDELLRLTIPMPELLPADRAEHVGEILSGDRLPPPIARRDEESVRTAEVIERRRVVGLGRDLGQSVGRPRLTRHVADRPEGRECPTQQIARKHVVTHVGLDPAERDERASAEPFVVEAIGQLERIRRGLPCLPMTSQLDQALGPPDGVARAQLRVDLSGGLVSHLERPCVQRFGQQRLVRHRLIGPPPEVERRGSGQPVRGPS